MTRPSWDEVWMQAAHAVASRSLCSRAKIGAVIVTADNRVESSSYNGPPPGFDHQEQECNHWCQRQITGATDPTYSNCPSGHAEANAIARSNFSHLSGATIYVTQGCCINCAKLIAQTGISRVVHIEDETKPYRNLEEVENWLRDVGIEVVRA